MNVEGADQKVFAVPANRSPPGYDNIGRCPELSEQGTIYLVCTDIVNNNVDYRKTSQR
jgi:hypothetical protein